MALDDMVEQRVQDDSNEISTPDLDLDKFNIAGYVRVSTRKQAEEGSHERQKETVLEWLRDNVDYQWDLTWFEDIAESGQDLSRDEHDKMMEMSDQFDMVVVRELSRFGRSLQKVLQDVERLKENGTSFVSIKDEQIDTTTAQGQLLFNIVAAFNQFWADMARERTEEMIEQRKEEGKKIGRPRKLTDEQIRYLKGIWEDNGVSYATLKTLAEHEYDVSVTRQTMARYMKEVELDDNEET